MSPAPAAAALLLLLLAGCSGAIIGEYDYRSGQPVRDAKLVAEISASVPATKAQVLAALGPPGEVLPLAAGDVFIYRLRLTDVDLLNLNTSIFTGIPVPFYAQLHGRQTDQVVFVQFDTEGRVSNMSEARP